MDVVMTIRIARVETYLYRAAISEPIKTSFGSIPRRSALLLRVEDADGAHGWGEVWCNFPPHSADNKQRLMETVIGPAAMRGSFTDPADAWHRLVAATSRWSIQSGEPGPIAACLAGLDLALWDMTARKQGVPLRFLLGAPAARSHVPAYASGLNPDSAVETMARARAAGFTAFKVKVAFGLEQDIRALDRASAALRPGEQLMADANQGWDIDDARRAVPRLAEYGLRWIEEPIPADSPPQHWAELAMLSSVALAGGENVAGFAAFQALIAARSHQVVQPDLLKWGGVTGCLGVGRAAVANGLAYCPHWLGSGLGLLAAAQLLAAVGGPGLLEHDVMESPLREPLAQPFPRVADGQFPLPDGPGLGAEPDLDAAAPYLLAHQELRPA
jgi:L-alanine-DL-glutamate epimerase-like enolase superfamily enzyme